MKQVELDIEFFPSGGKQLIGKFKEMSAVTQLVFQHKTRAVVTVSIAKGHTRYNNWVEVRRNFIVTHGRPRELGLGSLPCKYLKVDFVQGNLDGLVDFKAIGLQVRKAKSQLNKEDYNLLLSEPYKLIYGD